MLVFAAIVPHSPLLIPSIGKEHHEKLSLTLQAYGEIEHSLIEMSAETLVVISPHAQMYPDAFTGHMSSEYTGSLKEFGDHEILVKIKTDFLLLDHIHREMRHQQVPFTLTSQEELDYGFTIPLLLLTKRLQKCKLIPLSTSLLSPQQHVDFGKQLKQSLHAEERRVAIIASADLSHYANAQSPHGVTKEGQMFDMIVREKIHLMDTNGLLILDHAMVEQSGQCGYLPILILMGVLDRLNVTPKELCYEAPFGVGYLTESFIFA